MKHWREYLLNLSINPTYHCNFRCDFCYLTPEQLSDRSKVNLSQLDKRLSEVSKVTDINHIDLYGGEIGILTPDYFYALKEVIRKYYQGEININTNLSAFPDFFRDDDISLSVSFDFHARQMEDKVLNNMMKANKELAVLILASEEVIKMDVDFMVFTLNSIANVVSVEIKPYSTNQANQQNVTHKDFEDFVIKWIEHPNKNFHFENEWKVIDSLKGEYNAFSDDHVYINPNGNFSVLEFDGNDNEYFLELNTFNDYIRWTHKEKKDNVSDICRSCDYFGKCLTEHYRYVKDLKNSCNGYRGLLNYGRNVGLESKAISFQN